MARIRLARVALISMSRLYPAGEGATRCCWRLRRANPGRHTVCMLSER